MQDLYDIAEQLDKRRPVFINNRGEIIDEEEVDEVDDGLPVDPNTGRKVTKLKDHTWYSQWYESNHKRLYEEKGAVKELFPQFQPFKTEKGLMGWEGNLKTNSGHVYRVATVYPSDFPYSPIKAYIIEPVLKKKAPRHMYKDGSLCLFYPGDGTWQTNTTAATIIAIIAVWLFAYEYHEEKCGCRKISPCEHWPGKEKGHI